MPAVSLYEVSVSLSPTFLVQWIQRYSVFATEYRVEI